MKLHARLNCNGHVLLIHANQSVEFIRVDHETVCACKIGRRVPCADGLDMLARKSGQVNDLQMDKEKHAARE